MPFPIVVALMDSISQTGYNTDNTGQEWSLLKRRYLAGLSPLRIKRPPPPAPVTRRPSTFGTLPGVAGQLHQGQPSQKSSPVPQSASDISHWGRAGMAPLRDMRRRASLLFPPSRRPTGCGGCRPACSLGGTSRGLGDDMGSPPSGERGEASREVARMYVCTSHRVPRTPVQPAGRQQNSTGRG